MKKYNTILLTALLSLSMIGGDVYARGVHAAAAHVSAPHVTTGKAWGTTKTTTNWGTSKSTNTNTTNTNTNTFNWGTSSKAGTTQQPKTWGTNSLSQVGRQPSQSATDKTLASKVNIGGGKTASRADLVSKFESDATNRKNYTSTFRSEPAYRPTYIPTYYSDPYYHTYHYVYYNPSYMGYGYWNMWGQWVFINALHDAAMANANTYPVAEPSAGAVGIILGVTVIVVAGIVICAVAL